MNKSQQKQFEILCEVDRVCKKCDIDYSLDAGTLLGAVRHKGFIPWDDDIDIFMFRKDYEKFKKIVSDEISDKYFFQDYTTDENFGFVFGKVRIKNTKYTERINKKAKAKDGIFIDIFPIDNVSDDSKEAQRNFMKVVILRIMLLLKKGYIVDANTFLKKVEKIILKVMSLFISSKRIIKKINKITNKYNDIETEYVANFATTYFNKNKYKKEWLIKKCELDFEGRKFLCIKNYDKYLKYLYNDYMKLPPKEKRITHDVVEIKYED